MRPPPTTVELVEAIALQLPQLPALREQGAALDYGQLHGALVNGGLLLQQLGVRRGDRVAVAGPGFGVQLVLLLAAESLGAVTVSFQAENDADAPAIFGHVQFVLAAVPQAVPPGVHFLLVDAHFVRRLMQGVGQRRPGWVALEADEPQRICRTSGSGGSSKLMVLSRAAQEHWIRSGAMPVPAGAQARLLVLAPLAVNSAFTRSSAMLRQGGVVMVGAGQDIAALAPTYVWGLPAHLQRLLAELPAGYVSPQPVEVASIGGPLAPALRERLEQVFRSRPRNRYGSNETGSIVADVDADGTGILSAGVDVRIEDGAGGLLPDGAPGVIVVRTPSMTTGYLGRPEETARAFRDGWFVTGDVGAIVGWRKLQLSGRHDDLVNIGGIKLPAARLEAELLQQPAIAGCAVQAVILEGGAVTLGVALVLAPGATQEDAAEQARLALRLPGDTTVRLLVLSALPLLAGGKVDRMALLRMFGRG